VVNALPRLKPGVKQMNGNDEGVQPNVYQHGTAEHLAYEMQLLFGVDRAAYVLWMCDRQNPTRNISVFLDCLLNKYSIAEAEFCANYLEEFHLMPELMEDTREKIMMAFLDFDENDPDMRRFDD
jgi:hypothetical protein